MTTDRQNRRWNAICPDDQSYLRDLYASTQIDHTVPAEEIDRARYYAELLVRIFGQHNIKQDEMLMVKRKYIQEMYADCVGTHYLLNLFGDKCRPEKEPSAQVEPKFRKGDKVINLLTGEVHIIEDTDIQDGVWGYLIFDNEDNSIWLNEPNLEPYIEPETKELIASKSEAKDEAKESENNSESRNLSQKIANCDNPNDNQLKDNMEEKELNLCELLKGCEGETFYSDVFELVVLTKVNLVGNFLTINWNRLDLNLYSNGSKVKGNRCVLWPSKELYEKYPLDAPQAWREWGESRKSKRWRAQRGENYWFFDRTYTPYQQEESGDIEDEIMYDSYNYFRTEEEAQQAAEIIKEALQKFHEQSAK